MPRFPVRLYTGAFGVCGCLALGLRIYLGVCLRPLSFDLIFPSPIDYYIGSIFVKSYCRIAVHLFIMRNMHYLQHYRRERGLTQGQLSALSGVSHTTISKAEAYPRENVFTIQTVTALAKALEIDWDKLAYLMFPAELLAEYGYAGDSLPPALAEILGSASKQG